MGGSASTLKSASSFSSTFQVCIGTKILTKTGIRNVETISPSEVFEINSNIGWVVARSRFVEEAPALRIHFNDGSSIDVAEDAIFPLIHSIHNNNNKDDPSPQSSVSSQSDPDVLFEIERRPAKFLISGDKLMQCPQLELEKNSTSTGNNFYNLLGKKIGQKPSLDVNSHLGKIHNPADVKAVIDNICEVQGNCVIGNEQNIKTLQILTKHLGIQRSLAEKVGENQLSLHLDEREVWRNSKGAWIRRLKHIHQTVIEIERIKKRKIFAIIVPERILSSPTPLIISVENTVLIQ